MYIKKRGLDAENDLFLGKANKLVRLQFGDFPEFETSWLVKATWENMTFFGEKSKVISFFLNYWIRLSTVSFILIYFVNLKFV